MDTVEVKLGINHGLFQDFRPVDLPCTRVRLGKSAPGPERTR